MYRIILIDDEPLILAGIASLIVWEDYDCVIVGKATNGASAYEMIMKLNPDIVITDIRMPVLNGLELVEKCKTEKLDFTFIVLTNLEEFHLVKKALSLGAVDYLVKIELEAGALVEVLERAKQSCNLLMKQKQTQFYQNMAGYNGVDSAREYMNRLLLTPAIEDELPADLEALFKKSFIILLALCRDDTSFNPDEPSIDFKQTDQQITDILGKIASRTFHSFTLLTYEPLVYLAVCSLKERDVFEEAVQSFCTKSNAALKTYFELTAVFGTSSQGEMKELPSALKEAQIALEYYYYDSASPVVFYRGQQIHKSKTKSFNVNFLKKDLAASINLNDNVKLQSIFDQIIDLFAECRPNKDHATSACINIYTYLYSFFENDENSYQYIFPYTINVVQQLNHFNSLADILAWLQSFCDKLCRLLIDRRENHSDKLVEQAKCYVNEHYMEKLSLAGIADALNISYGYLSNSFKKYTGTTLSDYIAEIKIEHAKEMIDTHKYLMYEVSDQLGFDNAYYFSKVFKKITSLSPRDYENR